MSFVISAPETIAAAATDLAGIGSTLSAAHLAAEVPTVAVVPAAADEVSASIAHLFSAHAQDYQALAGRAAVSYEQFVQHLTASARSFASAEAANFVLLQPAAASAASIGSAIGAFWDQLVSLFNAAVAQLGNSLTSFLNSPTTFLRNLLGNFVLIVFFLFLLAQTQIDKLLGLPPPVPFL
jgi:PE family